MDRKISIIIIPGTLHLGILTVSFTVQKVIVTFAEESSKDAPLHSGRKPCNSPLRGQIQDCRYENEPWMVALIFEQEDLNIEVQRGKQKLL